jgi:hypothetical protein
MIEAFLSHKAVHRDEAKAVAKALNVIMSNDEIFRSEEIGKAEDFRDEITQALDQAKCFVLLYTDPTLDWSWCFYEAGLFTKANGGSTRPIYCLHPPDVDPPSPISNLQTIQARSDEIENWIRDDLCPVLKRRQPDASDLAESVQSIEKVVNNIGPVSEHVLKPYIWITPQWPGPDPAWHATDRLPKIDFSTAYVSIDAESALQLGFASAPRGMQLLSLLCRLDCDYQSYAGGIPFWVKKFYESLLEAVRDSLLFQEVAYFRHKGGGIIRPVVVSVAKNTSGTTCRLRIIFASAFGTPLTEEPSLVQRLADGVRLGVRMRLEVLEPFLGRMAQIRKDEEESAHRDDMHGESSVGGRVLGCLDAILQEATAHGFLPAESPAPVLFVEKDQQETYTQIRRQALSIISDLKSVAPKEDQNSAGEYPESERLLAELKSLTERYLGLAMPRLQELLAVHSQRS